jgi:hypothetical protein
MSKNYEIVFLNDITRVEFLTKPTFEDGIAAIDDIAENYPCEKRLWDLSKTEFDFTLQEIMGIAAHCKSKFTKPGKIAYIASDELVYGEMREMMVYREADPCATVCVFKTEQEAIDWLTN